MIFNRVIQVFVMLLLCCSAALAQDERANPEGPSPAAPHEQTASGLEYMVVTAHPLATRAGYEILNRGGHAVDAMVAAQSMLGLVEPQSSGLGGGAFVLYYDARQKRLRSFDARETAPGLAGPFLFYKNGKPMGFKQAQLGGKAVGVPGVPKLMADLHQAYGRKTWMELFSPSIRAAEEGFTVSPRLEAMIRAHSDDLKRAGAAADYFFNEEGVPLRAGDVLKNKAYAETLKDIAFYGANVFYDGAIADDIIRIVQNAPGNPGIMTAEDLRRYKVEPRKPVCAPYRVYKVCSMAEPSSGGLTILQILGMLEGFDLKALGPDSPQSWRLIAQASAMAFADRNMYMADPDFVNTPGVLLLDPAYIQQRRDFMAANRPLHELDIQAGKPPLWDGPLYDSGNGIDKPGTSHISIIDQDGNIIAMTSSIESAFGSHLMTGGFLLNNELTDFSFEPFGADQALIANMVEGFKRPRSSMAPVIVFDLAGNPVLTLGSAGGSRIIGYVVQRIISVLDWDMDLQQSVAMAHTIARSAKHIEVEEKSARSKVLEENGDVVVQGIMNSGLTGIAIQGDNLKGVADPRREGMAMGR